MFNLLWGMFKYVSKDLSRIDIFDNYFEESIKQHERDRSSDQAIEVKIANACKNYLLKWRIFGHHQITKHGFNKCL